MKKILTLIFLSTSFMLIAQDTKVSLENFQLSNVTSPAFLLVDETPTSVYTPENLRALMIHSLQNLGENLSIEVTPYFFGKNKDKTYYEYMGISHGISGNKVLAGSASEVKQKPFARIGRDLTISFAYINKEFNNLGVKNKVLSLGARTTLFKWYNNSRKMKIYNNAINRAVQLSNINPPIAIVKQGKDAIKKYQEEEFKKLDNEFTKTTKPMFQVDGALGYGLLFRDNNIESATLNRFGSWLTANFSISVLNKKGKTKKNNYLNIFAIGRYVEDGFSLNTNGTDNTLFYRDIGGKIELEVGDFSFGYEYIERNGSVDTSKSLGSIKYVINNDISITGGFGKDFTDTNNLITLFGVNWGLNFGGNEVNLK